MAKKVNTKETVQQEIATQAVTETINTTVGTPVEKTVETQQKEATTKEEPVVVSSGQPTQANETPKRQIISGYSYIWNGVGY